MDFVTKGSAVPVIPFNTTGQKMTNVDFGIEGLATEMANGKWIIPSVNEGGHLQAATPDLRAWVSELLFYTPGSHPGDRLMASWFARSGERIHRPKAQTGFIRTTAR